MDQTTGQSINNYILQRKLGEGGMGDVYLARHSKVERIVAIKILHQNLFTNETIRNRFKNEANALIKLVHPNIIKIYDYVEQETIACLIMEYFDGITLDDYINKLTGPIPAAKAIRIFGQVLDAVQYAHDRNILHRDIKPGNIMVSRDGNQVRIMDFGIAKLQDAVNLNITHANTQLGTPFYMSPEQVKGLPYTVQSDIYSLGVTLFEMVTGKCPYSGITNLFELQSKIVSEPLPSTEAYYPNVPAKIQEAIKTATNKNSSQRFKTCVEFKKFLEVEKETTSIQIATPQIVSEKKRSFSARKSKSNGIVYTAIFTVLFAAGIAVYSFLQKSVKLSENPVPSEHTRIVKGDSDKVNSIDKSFPDDSSVNIKADTTSSRIISNRVTKEPPSENVSKEAENKIPDPDKSEILEDLKNHGGLDISDAAEVKFNSRKKPFNAVLKFDDDNYFYLITAYYIKTESGYKYQKAQIKKTPKTQVQSQPTENLSNQKVIQDFISHLKKGKKYCDVLFNDESQISETEIDKTSHSGFGDINLDYYISFRISGKQCSAIVTYSNGNYIKTNF